MALINVIVVRQGVELEDQMEDFDWAALNVGDRVNTVKLGDIFTVKQKEVTYTDAGGSITPRRVLFTN